MSRLRRLLAGLRARVVQMLSGEKSAFLDAFALEVRKLGAQLCVVVVLDRLRL